MSDERRIIDDPASKLLLKTAEILRDCEWYNPSICAGFKHEHRDKHCVGTAMIEAATDQNASGNIVETACQRLERIAGEQMVRWNDADGRTKDEVISILQIAALQPAE